MMIALPCAVGLSLLGGPFLEIILPTNPQYPDLANHLLLGGSSFVIFFAFSTVTNAILQATDHLQLPVIHSAIALAIHTVTAFLLIRFFDLNVWGLMISTILFAVVLCVLNYIALRTKVGFYMELKTSIFLPLLASLFMGAAGYGCYRLIYALTGHNTISFLLAFIVAVIIYTIAVCLLKAVTEEELLSIPKGHKIVQILKKFRLLH